MTGTSALPDKQAWEGREHLTIITHWHKPLKSTCHSLPIPCYYPTFYENTSFPTDMGFPLGIWASFEVLSRRNELFLVDSFMSGLISDFKGLCHTELQFLKVGEPVPAILWPSLLPSLSLSLLFLLFLFLFSICPSSPSTLSLHCLLNDLGSIIMIKLLDSGIHWVRVLALLLCHCSFRQMAKLW